MMISAHSVENGEFHCHHAHTFFRQISLEERSLVKKVDLTKFLQLNHGSIIMKFPVYGENLLKL